MSTIVLVGCGKSKASEPCAARDLYTGNVFAARLAYAEATKCQWLILSARYGLIDPDEMIAPYDETLNSKSRVDRAAWAVGVIGQLLDMLTDDTDPREVCIEIHAGEDYAAIREVAQAVGIQWMWPVQHLGIGEQLAWYKEHKGQGPVRWSKRAA